MKLIVKEISANFWWGIYGITDKCGWEDLTIFYEIGERIGRVCLNTKEYLRAHLDDLKADPEEAEFVKAIEIYLDDNKIHYWYYYHKKDSEDFYEVPYKAAPQNAEGVRPCFFDMWHPDEDISISTIEFTVKEFGRKFLNKEITSVEVEDVLTFEEALQYFKEQKAFFEKTNY